MSLTPYGGGLDLTYGGGGDLTYPFARVLPSASYALGPGGTAPPGVSALAAGTSDIPSSYLTQIAQGGFGGAGGAGAAGAGGVGALGPGVAPSVGGAASAGAGAAGGGGIPFTGTGASILSDLPYAAGGGGGAGGLGSWLSNAFATNVGPKFLGGTGEASLGRLALPFAAGQAATYGLNKLLPSTGTAGDVRQVLADAASGAGIGGTVGSIFPGIGTAVGAGIGGGIGGLYGLAGNLFGGSSGASDKDLRATLENNAKLMGLTPSDYTSKFDLATQAGMTDAKGNKLSNQDIANYLGSQMSNEVATTRAQNEASAQALEFHKADLANNLALQSQAQQFMQPYQNNIISAGVNQAQVLNNLANQMPGQYKGVFQAQAAQALNQAQTMAGAYAQQIAMQPSMQILNNYQQQQQQQQALQERALQLAVQMRSQGAAGAGGAGFNGLLAQSTAGASPTGAPVGPYG